MRGLALGVLSAFASLAAPALLALPNSRTGDAYILSVGDRWISGGGDWDELVGMREKHGKGSGDFFWFRRAGKAYRIDDAATIAKAEALFAPLRALEPEIEELQRKEQRLDQKEESLDREQEEFERELEDLDADEEAGLDVDGSRRAELERGRQDVRKRMRAIEDEQHDLAADERVLDAREEDLETEAEGKLWRLIDAAIAAGTAKPAKR